MSAALFDDTLPLGAPRFDRILADDFLPALAEGAAAEIVELTAIAADPAPATFANTMEAMERSGARLARVRRIFWTVSSAQADDGIRAIEGEVSTLLARHGTRIAQDAALFARIKAVWDARLTSGLDEAQRRLVEASYRGFVAGGALLDADAKTRLAAIDERLATLGTRFGQNVLACEAGWSLDVERDRLAGLPDAMLAAAAARATAAGQAGTYRLSISRGDVESVLTFATERALREQVWRAFTGRCDGGAHDNWPVIDETLRLRHARAALLGYASFADYALTDTMAKTPAAAQALLERLWTPALHQAATEQATLQTLADADAIALEPWDWRYYAERVRRDRYALDGAAVKAHLTLGHARAAAFAVAGRLYGLTFAPRPDLPGWHRDVDAWLVQDRDGGEVGLLYTDYLARPEKHGGAWMGSLRVQEQLDGDVRPIVYLCANFTGSIGEEGPGLSLDEARTLFHEFGHALHGLLSRVVYPSQSGTAVARDFVEFPSKFMEHWIVSPEVLATLAVPPALIAAIDRADDFGQGFATIELAASSLLDLALHASTDPDPDARAIATATLARLHMPRTIVPRHGLPHFTHVFDGGYASGYYSYLWSEVLDADAFAAFMERGDVFAPNLAARFRTEILERGDSRDPAASFVAFRGRAPIEAPLLAARQLAPA